MIYLFNSGFYERHRVNVLDTMFLPDGARNRYRYGREHVPAGVWEGKDSLCGKECTVVFLDREHRGAYEFVPIRRGRIFRATTANDLLVVDVALEGFIYPANLAAFQAAFMDAVTDQMPALAGSGEPDSRDGFYIVRGDDLSLCLEDGINAWANAVDDLASRPVFANDKKESVFVRAELTKEDVRMRPKSSSGPDGRWGRGVGIYTMNPGAQYGLSLTYRHPGHGSKDAAHPIAIFATDNVKWGDNPELMVSAPGDVVEYRFTPDSETRHAAASLGLQDESESVRLPTARIHATVRRSIGFVLVTVFVLLVYAIADVASAAPHITSAVVAASIFKTFALGAMFWLFNKKVV